jgi:hypothetical protein
VSRDRALWFGVIASLLIVGLLIGQWFLRSPADAADAPLSEDSFRLSFWVNRRLDLLAQVGLILAGALGIAALLPRGRDDE